MDPYLTPAAKLRDDAATFEKWAARCDVSAEDYERAGGWIAAAVQSGNAANYLRTAASILRAAFAADGGTSRDLDHAELLTVAAARRDAYAAALTG